MSQMYFTGKNAAGYVIVTDPDLPGGKLEQETRQCAHCGYQWIYQPGSKNKYGLCMVCHGLTCSKPECNSECKPVEKRLEEQESRNKTSNYSL